MFTAVRSRKQTEQLVECSAFITVKLIEVRTIVKDQKKLIQTCRSFCEDVAMVSHMPCWYKTKVNSDCNANIHFNSTPN